ncbi:MAG: holdfast anchoring protein HfaA [Pseudomonadota bacterium]
MTQPTRSIGAALFAVGSLFATTALSAQAQRAGSDNGARYTQPYGLNYGADVYGYRADNGRDANGNRVIIDGLLNGGSGLGYGLNTRWGQTEGYSGMIGSALGNQLNVTVDGNYNTVIIDSTQINNGDQTVILNGE